MNQIEKQRYKSSTANTTKAIVGKEGNSHSLPRISCALWTCLKKLDVNKTEGFAQLDVP